MRANPTVWKTYFMPTFTNQILIITQRRSRVRDPLSGEPRGWKNTDWPTYLLACKEISKRTLKK